MERFKSVMKIEKPDEVEVSLNVTMSLGDWEALSAQLNTGFPSWKLRDLINNSVKQIEAKVFLNSENKE